MDFFCLFLFVCFFLSNAFECFVRYSFMFSIPILKECFMYQRITYCVDVCMHSLARSSIFMHLKYDEKL